MPLSPPLLHPPGDELKTISNVTETPQVSDVGSNDTTALFWGRFEPPAGTPGSPNKPVDIAKTQICDGMVEVWYSAEDAIGNVSYSESASVTVAGTGQILAAPVLVPAGNAPAAGMNVTVSMSNSFNLATKLEIDDNVHLHIKLWDLGASPWKLIDSYNPEPYPVDSVGPNGTFEIRGVRPAPAAGQAVTVSMEIEKIIDYGDGPVPRRYQSFLSTEASAQGSDWYGAQGNTLPQPIFTDASNGTIVVDQLPAYADIGFEIPSTAPITSSSTVQIIGWGTDQPGQIVPATTWSSDPITGITRLPYTGTPIPRDKVNAVPDQGHYNAYYTVDGKGSPQATALIRNNGTPPPSGQTGTLWGWGLAGWGTLG